MTQDQIYTDLITNVLPKIQEWLVITKEYAFDIFARYQSLLIIQYSFWAIVFLVSSLICFYICKKLYNKLENGDDIIWVIVTWIIGVVFLFWVFVLFNNLIEVIYVPEISIYNKLKWF